MVEFKIFFKGSAWKDFKKIIAKMYTVKTRTRSFRRQGLHISLRPAQPTFERLIGFKSVLLNHAPPFHGLARIMMKLRYRKAPHLFLSRPFQLHHYKVSSGETVLSISLFMTWV